MDMNTNERNAKGQWKEMNAQWKENACKWKEHEGKCIQINAIRKEHEVLPKHLKPTKQPLDPFPSLFRNDFGFMLDLEDADFHKTLESDRAPPKAITITRATTEM